MSKAVPSSDATTPNGPPSVDASPEVAITRSVPNASRSAPRKIMLSKSNLMVVALLRARLAIARRRDYAMPELRAHHSGLPSRSNNIAFRFRAGVTLALRIVIGCAIGGSNGFTPKLHAKSP